MVSGTVPFEFLCTNTFLYTSNSFYKFNTFVATKTFLHFEHLCINTFQYTLNTLLKWAGLLRKQQIGNPFCFVSDDVWNWIKRWENRRKSGLGETHLASFLLPSCLNLELQHLYPYIHDITRLKGHEMVYLFLVNSIVS